MPSAPATTSTYFNPRTPRGVRRQRVCTISMGNRNFNPRTPRGVRLIRHVDLLHDFEISIHAPREGCDSLLVCTRSACVPFQSTHPARGATHRHIQGRQYSKISIHAPREGCDRFLVSATYTPVLFQSTHPARGATANFTKEQRVCLAQFAYLHKGKKAEHTKTNAPMLHEAFLYAFWVRTGRRRRVLLDFARYKIKGSSGR